VSTTKFQPCFQILWRDVLQYFEYETWLLACPALKKSSLLTTFNTLFGRYCYRCLPFGLHSSAEVFEKKVEQVFDGIQVAIYFDDLIVAGRTQKEHDDNLEKLL